MTTVTAQDAAIHQHGAPGTVDDLFVAFRQQRRKMFFVARSIVGPDDAADVVQHVITRAWHQRERFDSTRSSWGTYLLMMTKAVAIDHTRQATSRRLREQRTAGRGVSADDSFASAIRDQHETRVAAALRQLPSNERELIVSAFYGGQTHRQLAVELGLPEGTVKSRIRSGLRKLRHTLADLIEIGDTAVGRLGQVD